MNMLVADPKYRYSMAECLNSPYFDDIRDRELEKTSSSKLYLNIDYNDAFDYKRNINLKYSRYEMQMQLWDCYLT
jgi:serine/threonine protein kinase